MIIGMVGGSKKECGNCTWIKFMTSLEMRKALNQALGHIDYWFRKANAYSNIKDHYMMIESLRKVVRAKDLDQAQKEALTCLSKLKEFP